MNSKKLLIITAMLCIFFTSASDAFSDLPSNHWAYDVVNEMVDNGAMVGYPDGTFKPENLVTRAEFAAMLVKTLKIKESGNAIVFKDVEGVHWGEEYIELASPFLTGYITNGEYYFKPNEAALREDAAVALVKAKGFVKGDVKILNRFNDKEDISENLAEYVASAVEQGLMSGYPEGDFRPKQSLTRAEIAALFNKIYKAEKEYNEEEKIVVDDLEKEQLDREENNKQDILWGDLNGDEIVNYDDEKILYEYSKGRYTLSNSQKKLADVFVDEEIDEMDVEVLRKYVNGKLEELPHACGNYRVINNLPYDERSHTIALYCDCGKVEASKGSLHVFRNGKCICGAKQIQQEENDIAWDGEYISNINGLTKVKLTKISDTEVNFYITGIEFDEEAIREGTLVTGFGFNDNAVITGDIAKARNFDETRELTFRFEGKDLVIEAYGYEDVPAVAGTYKVDDGSTSEIEWTIPRNPIEGEYLFGANIENIELGNAGSPEELQKYLQTVPDSISILISDAKDDSATFSMGGVKEGNLIFIFGDNGALKKSGNKWKYFDEEDGADIEISFEDEKAIVTGSVYNGLSVSGTYIKNLNYDYDRFEEALDNSWYAEGTWSF